MTGSTGGSVRGLLTGQHRLVVESVLLASVQFAGTSKALKSGMSVVLATTVQLAVALLFCSPPPVPWESGAPGIVLVVLPLPLPPPCCEGPLSLLFGPCCTAIGPFARGRSHPPKPTPVPGGGTGSVLVLVLLLVSSLVVLVSLELVSVEFDALGSVVLSAVSFGGASGRVTVPSALNVTA